jgi:hypothetical protein
MQNLSFHCFTNFYTLNKSIYQESIHCFEYVSDNTLVGGHELMHSQSHCTNVILYFLTKELMLCISDGPLEGIPLIDDYIAQSEQVGTYNKVLQAVADGFCALVY